MAKIDRTVFTTNDQDNGDIADPNKLEANDSHIADVVDTNDTEFNNHKSSTTLDHPDGSVTSLKLADDAVVRSKLATGAVGKDELDPNLWEQTAYEAKFSETDLKLDEIGVYSNSYSTLQTAIDDAVSQGKSLIIGGNHTLNSEVLYITSPISIYFTDDAFFNQTEFAYPIFDVQSEGVEFHGKLRAENLGTPYHITSQEIEDRNLTVPVNDSKGYSAAIACIQNVDDLYVEHVESENFVTTISFLSSVSDDSNYSSNVKVDYARGIKQWQTVLGGGFKSARFGEVIGENMVWSQGDNPNHVLYFGTRPSAPDHYVYVERVIGYNSVDMSYIAQIKTVSEFVCNEVIGYNCPRSFHTSDCQNAKIGSVKGIYISDTTNRDSVLKVAGGSKCVIETIDITTNEVHDSVNLSSASVVSSVGTGTLLEIMQLNLKLTDGSNPMRAIRTSSILKTHKVNIEHVSAPSINPIECSAAEIYMYEPPIIKGANGLAFSGINVVDYYLSFDPNLVEGEMGSSTIMMNDNNFSKLHFEDFDKQPPEWSGGSTSYRFRAINTLKVKDGGFTVDTFNYSSEMQEYVLLKGSDGTSPALSHGTGNMYFKNGTGYSANGWDMLKFMSVNGNLYEV